MIYRALTEIILAVSLIQFFPVDAGTIESYARLPEAGSRPDINLEEVLLATRSGLPLAKDSARPAPRKVRPESVGVVTAASSALVMDAASGAVLFKKNVSDKRSIGSMTKLMTSLIFLSGQPDLSAAATVETSDLREGGRLHVPVSASVTILDLLKASLISSDNSATIALVRFSGLSEGDFVARMNEKAAEIGMTDTTFADPTGLSPENRSNVPDLAVLLRAALQNESVRTITAQAAATITDMEGKSYLLENTNELLADFINQEPYKIIGGKTGYLPEAGYCLGVQTQKDGGKDLFVVVLGSDSTAGRLRDVKALTVWAYNTYEWQ